MKTKLLKLAEVCTTAGTQIRSSINHDAVDEYATAMIDGAKFPPVVVFHDGSDYILADGFHRVMAASRNGFNDIEADVRKGTKSDALKFALGANTTHGIKRTNADKRRSVELALAEWPRFSNVKLSEICAVSDEFVRKVRDDLQPPTIGGSQLEESSGSTRIGSDGKTRKLPTKTLASVPTVQAKEVCKGADAVGASASPAPVEPRTEDAEFLAAAGIHTLDQAANVVAAAKEPCVVEYYTRLENLVNDALENATDKQLASMSVYAATINKRIKEQLAHRKQMRKAA